MLLEPLIGHAGLGRQGPRQAPRSPATDRRQDGVLFWSTEPEQVAYPGPCIAPLLPVAQAHSSAQPTSYFGYDPVILRYTVVVHPAPQTQGKLFHPILHGDKPAVTGQPPDASFEFSQRRIRPADFTTDDGKAQEAGLIHPGDLAFGLVVLELEFAFDETFDRCHHALARPLTLHHDDEVSSPGELHPQALSEPDVNLSAHPAPIIQPTV